MSQSGSVENNVEDENMDRYIELCWNKLVDKLDEINDWADCRSISLALHYIFPELTKKIPVYQYVVDNVIQERKSFPKNNDEIGYDIVDDFGFIKIFQNDLYKSLSPTYEDLTWISEIAMMRFERLGFEHTETSTALSTIGLMDLEEQRDWVHNNCLDGGNMTFSDLSPCELAECVRCDPEIAPPRDILISALRSIKKDLELEAEKKNWRYYSWILLDLKTIYFSLKKESIMPTFSNLISSFTPTIFTWSFYSDFPKIAKNSFKIKVELSILNSLLGERNIESKFIDIIRQYPETREVLPLLLAVRGGFGLVLDGRDKRVFDTSALFGSKSSLTDEQEKQLLEFFRESGLKSVFENKHISDLNDYVFGVETGLDSNARKNRSGTMMEVLVGDFITDFCKKNSYQCKDQATVKWILENWGVKIESDKSARRFDFAIFTGKKVYLFETNFYGGGGSKLKAVAGEFSGLYPFLERQGVQLLWITDGLGWQTTLRPLEDAYNVTNGNIYNLAMLKDGILEQLIK